MTKRKNKPGAGPPITSWPPEKVKELKKLYPGMDNEIVAAALNETVSAIRNAAVRFGVKKAARYWDKTWEDYVLNNWDVMSATEISEGLKDEFEVEKTRWAVINKYRELTKQ